MTRERYDQLLHELDDAVVDMGNLVAATIAECIEALEHQDINRAQELIEADSEIDRKRYDIERQTLLLIATQQPLAGDLRSIVAILTVATELERIGDYCEGIAKLIMRMAVESARKPSLVEIHEMAERTQELLCASLEAFRDRDVAAAGVLWTRDDEVDELYEQAFRKMLLSMVSDPQTIRLGTYLLWVAHNVERMADRVTNIAERVAFIVTGDIARFREQLEAQTLPK